MTEAFDVIGSNDSELEIIKEEYGEEDLPEETNDMIDNQFPQDCRPIPLRSRAMSFSLDWDRVVASTKPKKANIKSISSETLVLPQGFKPAAYIQFERSEVTFPTGSSYTGRWNLIGMEGTGRYQFPHGVEYEGNLQDGMFHGDGTLTYPMGHKLEGEWYKGKLICFKFQFDDLLDYDVPWKYCKMPDRRFHKSIQEGLRPAGRSLLTNSEVAREIPKGCYDTGDGFYNPKTKCVWSAIEPNKIIRIPSSVEEKWIIENCRKAWDEPTGYRPDLYEHWHSGRETDSVCHKPDSLDENDDSSNFYKYLSVPSQLEISSKYKYSCWESRVHSVSQTEDNNIYSYV